MRLSKWEYKGAQESKTPSCVNRRIASASQHFDAILMSECGCDLAFMFMYLVAIIKLRISVGATDVFNGPSSE